MRMCVFDYVVMIALRCLCRSSCCWLFHDVKSMGKPLHLSAVCCCCRVGSATLHARSKTIGVSSFDCSLQLCHGPA